jgi:glycine hydroxymethyltransferase
MVPFDDKSPFVTLVFVLERQLSPPRGLVEKIWTRLLTWQSDYGSHNEEVIEQVANEVNEMMSERAILFSKNLFKVPG